MHFITKTRPEADDHPCRPVRVMAGLFRGQKLSNAGVDGAPGAGEQGDQGDDGAVVPHVQL